MKWRWFRNSCLSMTIVICEISGVALGADRIPSRAYAYRHVLRAEERRAWGLNMPADTIAIGAGTIHQESVWNPMAQSSYAKGLAQFTGTTWKDMLSMDHSIAVLGDIWNPHAAIRAMCFYHRRLWDSVHLRYDADSRWAAMLSSYNGGLGWLERDQRLAANSGANPSRWFGHVEFYSARSAAAFRENRDYVRQILLRWRPLYVRF